MDADGLPIVGHGIDLTKVDAIHQKRTLTFINHFITHTTNFLNRFSSICEEKLENLSNRIHKLETIMTILEAKLSSIPGLEDVTVPSMTTTTEPQVNSTPESTTETAQQHQSSLEETTDSKPDTTPSKPTETVSKDPRYARYFRMQAVGVPTPAIKMKMQVDGLNPDLLDTPDAAVTDGGAEGEKDSTRDKDNSDDSSDSSD